MHSVVQKRVIHNAMCPQLWTGAQTLMYSSLTLGFDFNRCVVQTLDLSHIILYAYIVSMF